jgi:hypothetical protein
VLKDLSKAPDTDGGGRRRPIAVASTLNARLLDSTLGQAVSSRTQVNALTFS